MSAPQSKTRLLSLRDAAARCGVAASTISRRAGVFAELNSDFRPLGAKLRSLKLIS